MARFLVHRLAGSIAVLFVVSLIVFGLALLIPGDPAIQLAGEGATRAEIAAVHLELGLDRPMLERYGDWAWALLQGDAGRSLLSAQPVVDMIGERLPVSLSLAFLALALSILIAIPCGTLAALRPGSWIDRTVTVTSSLAISTPSFWLGLMLILVLAVELQLFPSTGYVALTDSPLLWLYYLALPALTLGTAAAVEPTRQLRAGLLDVLDSDYVRTARGKGLPERTVVFKHALRNASLPFITVLGVEMGQLLGGVVVVEIVFGLPGLGSLAITAVRRTDLPVLQGIVLVTTVVVLLVNLLVDLSYRWLSPGEAR